MALSTLETAMLNCGIPCSLPNCVGHTVTRDIHGIEEDSVCREQNPGFSFSSDIKKTFLFFFFRLREYVIIKNKLHSWHKTYLVTYLEASENVFNKKAVA